MNAPKIRSRDWLRAERTEILSTVGEYLPTLRDYVAKANVATYTQLRWRRACQPADNIDHWVEFEGNELSGKMPRSYGESAIFSVSQRDFDAQMNSKEGGVQAVAYRIGTAAMVGTLDQKSRFFSKNLETGEYRVAMRIGSGALQATVGIWIPTQREFFSPVEVRAREQTVYPTAAPLEGVPLV